MDARLHLRKIMDRLQNWRVREYPSIDLCKKVFAFFGSWHAPSDQKGAAKVCRYFLPRLPLYVSVYGFFIGHPWLAYQSKGKDMHLTVESASATFMAAMMSCAFGCLLYRREPLDSLFIALEEMKACSLKLAKRPASILNRNRKIQEYTLYFIVIGLAFLALSLIPLPLMIQKRKLIFYHWYPFDATASPAYEVVLVYTTLSHVVGMSTMLAFHTLLISMCLEARGQFLLLSNNLASINKVAQGEAGHRNIASNEYTEGLEDNNSWSSATRIRDPREEIKVCVLLHNAILRFVQEMESAFSLYLCMMLICTLVPSGMCILLIFYADSGDRIVQYSFLIVASNIGTLLCCWMGNELTLQDEAVREAVYECDWFDQSESFKRSMRIMMSHSNQPVVVKVAGFVPL